jgi:RNA recognition motif-containing protein
MEKHRNLQKTIYIGNLMRNISKKELYKYFNKFGKIKKIITMHGIYIDKSKKLACIEYYSQMPVNRAFKSTDKNFMGQICKF